MSGLHLADLDGAWRAVRSAVADEIRTYGDDFTDAVYGDSRASEDERDALGLIVSAGKDFAVVVLANGISTEFDEDDSKARRRRYDTALIIVQRYSDGEGEDIYLDRVELIENRLAARSVLPVDLGFAGGDLDFDVVALETLVPIGITRNAEYEAIAHRTIRNFAVEVIACA